MYLEIYMRVVHMGVGVRGRAGARQICLDSKRQR